MKNSLFIDVIILILLWRVIHFQQIYLECMLLFAMYGSLHLTSVWLHMSVVFVVTAQWPTGTNMTSPFILFLNTYPFSMSLKAIHSARNQTCKILGKSDAWQWKSLKHFVLSSINHQLSTMCNVKMNCWWS